MSGVPFNNKTCLGVADLAFGATIIMFETTTAGHLSVKFADSMSVLSLHFRVCSCHDNHNH